MQQHILGVHDLLHLIRDEMGVEVVSLLPSAHVRYVYNGGLLDSRLQSVQY